MATSGTYCKECDCSIGSEPCSKCILWEQQCHGTCRCCQHFNESLWNMSKENGKKTYSAVLQSQSANPPSTKQVTSQDVTFLGPSALASAVSSHSSSTSISSLSDSPRTSEHGKDKQELTEKYCTDCDCTRGNEPCFSCINWDFQCHGVCVCCEAFNRALSSLDPHKDLTVPNIYKQAEVESVLVGNLESTASGIKKMTLSETEESIEKSVDKGCSEFKQCGPI